MLASMEQSIIEGPEPCEDIGQGEMEIEEEVRIRYFSCPWK